MSVPEYVPTLSPVTGAILTLALARRWEPEVALAPASASPTPSMPLRRSP